MQEGLAEVVRAVQEDADDLSNLKYVVLFGFDSWEPEFYQHYMNGTLFSNRMGDETQQFFSQHYSGAEQK